MALIKELEKQGNWLFRHRGELPVILFLIQVVVYFFTLKKGDYFFDDFNQWNFICLAVAFLGMWIRALVIGQVPKGTSGRNTVQGQVAEVLNSTGIYSVVRHPLYVGNFFMWLGIAMISQHLWFILVFILIYWIYYERIMYAEEQFLSKKFGEAYFAWSDKVPAFIPNLILWKPSNLSFSFKNILKREYAGFFNTFLGFFIFEAQRAYVFQYSITYTNGWLILLVGSGVLALVLRMLRKKTKLLDVEGR